jgi:hypothetical protein
MILLLYGRAKQAAENSIRREAGVQPPHKVNRMNSGFSPGSTPSASFTGIPEFFRSLCPCPSIAKGRLNHSSGRCECYAGQAMQLGWLHGRARMKYRLHYRKSGFRGSYLQK